MHEVGSLYVALSALGWTPRQVDGLELWEAAMLLDHPAVQRTESVTVDRTRAVQPGRDDGPSDLIRRRIEAAKAGMPPPSFAAG